MFIKKVMAEIAGLAASRNTKIYIVGGFLRDLYLGSPGRDLDFAVSGNALGFARDVSEILEGAFVPLDRVNGVARVILEHQEEKWQIDFAALKGRSLEEDLASRDFTINAMALELATYLRLSEERGGLTGRRPERWRWHGAVTDPYGGLADLENKIIRAVNNYVFEADPIRILRGIRLAGQLKFFIKPETMDLMEQGRWLLHEVAGERLWEELLGILALPDSYPWIAMMDAMGVLSELLPFVEKMKITGRNSHRADSVWVHSLKTYQLLEDLCRDLGSSGVLTTSRGEELREKLLSHLHGRLPAGHRRFQLLKLAALFHDAGKVDTARVLEDGRITYPGHHEAGLVYVAEFARRLKISKSEESYLKALVDNHMYPLYLFVNQPVGPSAIHRFFARLGRDTTDVLLLSLADVTATYIAGEKAHDLARYRTFTGDLLNKYHFEAGTYVNPPELVKGEDLMAALGLAPSKKLGDLLKKIAEAQIRGEVTSREEAISYASRLLKDGSEDLH
ncbi:MAG: HD domain-containing protein [Peptococcaceae bacterium]|nr:HD domain-containing protein [Peptococcaceae bacterium]